MSNSSLNNSNNIYDNPEMVANKPVSQHSYKHIILSYISISNLMKTITTVKSALTCCPHANNQLYKDTVFTLLIKMCETSYKESTIQYSTCSYTFHPVASKFNIWCSFNQQMLQTSVCTLCTVMHLSVLIPHSHECNHLVRLCDVKSRTFYTPGQDCYRHKEIKKSWDYDGESRYLMLWLRNLTSSGDIRMVD